MERETLAPIKHFNLGIKRLYYNPRVHIQINGVCRCFRYGIKVTMADITATCGYSNHISFDYIAKNKCIKISNSFFLGPEGTKAHTNKEGFSFYLYFIIHEKLCIICNNARFFSMDQNPFQNRFK